MNFVNIGFLTKVNVNNMNSGEGYGNITVLKKVEGHDGKKYVYISGQAVRRYLKETMQELEFAITPCDESGEAIIDKSITATKDLKQRLKEIIKKYPDLDLFGFMQAKGVRRWSAFKTTPLLSVYPYIENEDLLLRNQGFKTEEGKENQRKANLVKIELNVFNYMRGSFMVDYDRIGLFEDELTWEKEEVINSEERKNRYSYLIKGIRYLNGGAKSARLMDDLTPIFVIAAILKAGTPVFLNTIELNDEKKVNVEAIQKQIKTFKGIISKVYIGCNDASIADIGQLQQIKEAEVSTIGELFDKLEKYNFS